jgi:hypothetical protein
MIVLKNYSLDPNKSMETNVILRDSYKLAYEYAYGINTELPDGVLMPSDIYEQKEEIYYQYLRYDYYVNTKTSFLDYVDIDSPFETSIGLEDGVFKVVFGNFSFYIVSFLSIIIALSIGFSDIDNNKIKNTLQSKIKIREIMIGKIIFLVTMLILMVLLITITNLLISDNTTNVLLVDKGFVEVIKTSKYFISKMIINLSYGILLAMLSFIIRLFVKKTYFTGFLTFSSICFSFGLYSIVKTFMRNDVLKENLKKGFLFVNSQLYNVTYNQKVFTFIITFNILISVFLGLLLLKKMEVQELY